MDVLGCEEARLEECLSEREVQPHTCDYARKHAIGDETAATTTSYLGVRARRTRRFIDNREHAAS